MRPGDLPHDELRREARELAGSGSTDHPLAALLRAGPVDRRRLFRVGGLAAFSGVFLAACGETDTAGTVTVPPRLGTVPPPNTLPDAPVTDVTLLRTATSLEYLAIDTYTLVLDELSSLFSGDAAALVPVVERFREDHQRHADAGVELTTELGGEPYACANTRLMALYVAPAVELIVGTEAAVALLGIEGSAEPVEASPDPLLDVLTLAHGLETLAAATYQSAVSTFNNTELRSPAATIAAEETRHATLLARVIAPETILPGEEGDLSAVPATFGQLGQISFRIGKRNEVGNKTQVTLDTPSLNSFVYEYQGAC
jgi:hypothetical protein